MKTIIRLVLFIVCLVSGFMLMELVTKSRIEEMHRKAREDFQKYGPVLTDAVLKDYRYYVDSIKKDFRFRYPDYFGKSVFFAHYYDYAPAYYDVYEALMTLYKNDTCAMDEHTRAMTAYYLRRGAEKGDKKCREILKERERESHHVER